MTILEAIEENSKMQIIKDSLIKLFRDYDSAIEEYSYYVHKDIEKNEEVDTDAILQNVNETNNVKETLKNIIKTLNQIQVIFEQLGYNNNATPSDDVDERSFIQQLEQLSTQMLKLYDNFVRENFPAFNNGLNYMTALAEIHYNNKFGDLEEDIEINNSDKEILEDAKEYLDELPEIKTNEVK